MTTQLSLFDTPASAEPTPIISDTDWCAALPGDTSPIAKEQVLNDTQSDPLSVIMVALRRLAIQDSDGATQLNDRGFSKPDSYTGHRWASADTLSESDALAALDMLRKYAHTQLADLVLPERESLAQAAKLAEARAGKIVKVGESLIVSFPYNAKHVEAVKSLPAPDRKYNGTDKSWIVALQAGRYLLDLFPNFAISQSDKAAILSYVIPERSKTYPGTISVHGNTLILTFAYDKALMEVVKKLGAQAKKNKKTGAWSWEAPLESAQAFLDTLTDWQVLPGVNEAVQAHKVAQDSAAKVEAEITARLTANLDTSLRDGKTMFAHQVEGAKFALAKRRAILAADMGTGKSITALVAARAYGVSIHVVCPKSLELNWQREAAMVGVSVQTHSWAKIPAAPSEPFVLICDEAHYAQNLSSQRTKAMLALSDSPFCQGVYLLTGTPIKNGRPVNLFPLLKATRHKLAQDRTAYETYYCDAHPTRFTKWDTSGAQHLDELHTNTRDVMWRVTKDQCLDLPEKTRVMRGVELSKEAEKLYDTTLKALKADYQARLAKGEIMDGAEALVLLTQLRHAASVAKAEDACAQAQDILEEGGQVVIFVAFKDTGETIAQCLGVQFFSGDTPAQTRQQMVDDFQAGKSKAFVCSLGAGGVGITLTAAQTVILVDRPWTPGDAEQAADRLHRIGQKNAVTAVWLQYGDADTTIDQILQAKQERIDLVLEGKRKTLRGVGGSLTELAQQLLPELLG